MPNVPILKWFIVLFKTKLVENETERAKKKSGGGGGGENAYALVEI